MNVNAFLSKENVNTIWDVISDEDIYKFLSKEYQIQVLNVFTNNIKGFYETEKQKNSDLVTMNKKYIILILNHIKKIHPYQPNKIKISNEEAPVKELITFEEIHNDRKSQFEKDVEKRQNDFEDMIKIKAPPAPTFADDYNDAPISEMDKILKEMTSKRNYEVEQINRNYNADITQVNNWLKPQDTSLKGEKLMNSSNNSNNSNNNSNNNSSPGKKNVTWGNNDEFMNNVDIVEEVEDIFKKLKKKEKPNNSNNNILLSIEERSNDDRIERLENQMSILNDKMSKILQILENK
jgi:hypothetical protein